MRISTPRPAGRNLQPDHHCLPNGVTTAVLAGVSKKIEPAKTRLLAFVEPDHAWIEGAVGILANQQNLDRALKAAELNHTIVMFEGGEQSSEAEKRLRPGDIRTHMYGRSDVTGRAQPRRTARFGPVPVPHRRAGHPGSLPAGYNFHRYRHGEHPAARADMMTTLSKFINLGMTPNRRSSARP